MAEPRTDEERAVVNSRLRQKYPQMYEKSWVKRLKKYTKAELKKRKKGPIKRIVEHRQGEMESLQGALSKDEMRKYMGSK